MRKIGMLIALALMVLSCRSEYRIDGSVSGQDRDGEYVYLYRLGEDFPVDSARVEDGKFHLTGVQDTAALYSLHFPVGKGEKLKSYGPGQDGLFSPVFVLENASLKVVLDTVSRVEGSRENELKTRFQARILPLCEEWRTAGLKYYKGTDKKKYYLQSDSLKMEIAKLGEKYIRENEGSLSALYVMYLFRYELDEDWQMEFFDKAESTFGSQPWLENYMKHLAVRRTVAAGKQFVDFEMADTEGNLHRLSEYAGKGEVVLLSFWASWCPTCIYNLPQLLSALEPFKGNEDFKVIGISLDRSRKLWLDCIEKNGLDWIHLSDQKKWDNHAAKLYGINFIPSTVLIDKEGTIVAHNLLPEVLSDKIKDLLK